MKVLVLLGSAREGRAGEAVSTWVMNQLAKNTAIEAELVDLAALALPFYNEAVIPSEIHDRNYTNPAGRAWAEKVGSADAYIFLTAEYNHGYTALLKNAIDWVYFEWVDKPVGFIGYSSGAVAGARVVEQLKPVCIHVGLHPLGGAINIPKVASFFTNNEPSLPGFNEQLVTMCESLTKYSTALRPLRKEQA